MTSRAGCLIALTFLFTSGCGGEAATTRFRTDAGAFHVRGDYLGSQRRVKLFVESLRADPLRQERGTLFVMHLVLLNERLRPARFELGEAKLDVDGTSYSPVETHTIQLPPGELKRVTVSFRTKVKYDHFVGGTVELSGIEPEEQGGPGVRFAIPFSGAGIESGDEE